MPRSIVTGNGSLLVGIDEHNMLKDMYFPYVGMEDQIAYLHFHRIGIHTDNRFSWLFQGGWKHNIRYIPETLVTDSKSENAELGITVHSNDFVYPSENFLIRKLTFKNNADHNRMLRVFFYQDFHLYGDKQQDTAFYHPGFKAMVHYRKKRYFWISGMAENHLGIDSFTTGKSEYQGREGTWRDAEDDGQLHENPIEQGSVDSTVQFNLPVNAQGEAVLYFWICAGKTLQEVQTIQKFIMDEAPEKLLHNTINYWSSWVNKGCRNIINKECQIIEDATEYKQSLLIIRTQIDNGGAIIAANDSDIMKFNKDTYSYMWPRDGAWVSLALDRAGYGEVTERFFRFCSEVVHKDGYLFHKYNPDRSIGSSWHPWYKNGEIQIPIQEDETAIVLHALWWHFQYFSNIEFLQEMYSPLIRRAANFLAKFIDDETGLPMPTYDLWERERGIFSYTCAAVYAGLEAAANLCDVLGHFNHYRRYKKAAKNIKGAILEQLYDEESGRFLKRIEINPHSHEVKKDYMIDASLHGLWMFGLLPADDPRIVRTNEAVYNALRVNTKVGGLARSEGDDYQRVLGDYSGIPGNPWIITTLWHAQWLLATAKEKKDLEPVRELLKWTVGHMNDGHVLPEQLNPFTGEHLSVAPLTWSHSTYVDTVLKYSEKMMEFEEEEKKN